MASYKLEWKKSAVKDLKNLPRDLMTKVLRAVEQLAENPFPHGVKKLTGAELRIGFGRAHIEFFIQSPRQR